MSQHYQSHGTNKSYWEFYVLLIEQIRSLVACGRTVGPGPGPCPGPGPGPGPGPQPLVAG